MLRPSSASDARAVASRPIATIEITASLVICEPRVLLGRRRADGLALRHQLIEQRGGALADLARDGRTTRTTPPASSHRDVERRQSQLVLLIQWRAGFYQVLDEIVGAALSGAVQR